MSRAPETLRIHDRHARPIRRARAIRAAGEGRAAMRKAHADCIRRRVVGIVLKRNLSRERHDQPRHDVVRHDPRERRKLRRRHEHRARAKRRIVWKNKAPRLHARAVREDEFAAPRRLRAARPPLLLRLIAHGEFDELNPRIGVQPRHRFIDADVLIPRPCADGCGAGEDEEGKGAKVFHGGVKMRANSCTSPSRCRVKEC